MVASFWLGTFNLLTLQFVTMVTIFQYIPFMFASIFVFRRARNLAFLVFPAAWTVFDWLRSMRFLGYPWGMLGASQYSIIPLIQISSLTGVWGVTFLVILSNSVIAGYITPLTSLREVKTRWVPAVVLAAAFALSLGWGIHKIKESAPAAQPAGMGRTVRLSLVQQNADPRKDDYRAVFDTLTRLTDEALRDEPDIVVWSETAFVPNIRRWSAEDPQKHELAALVRDLLAYQERSGTWLITGNDDYLLTADGSRLDYNGSVLFSPAGERVETYHKMHLVPFTEYFPFQRHLPGVYRLLQNFDAYLWEPGDRRVVFRHPRFSFSTPICFEDTFPNDVRLFVQEGAEAIVNLSNDYWSLTEAEAMQHAANAVFRAVENGRPLARASASGLTCSVDSLGRITARAPFFKECFLTVDLPIAGQRATLYTAWGDWFPAALCVAIAFLVGWSMVARRR
jgi:apolipoprotein N-acyltransferase